MNKETVLGLIRHILTTAGGAWIAAKIGISGDEWQAAAGAIVVIIGVIWSAIDKRKRANA